MWNRMEPATYTSPACSLATRTRFACFKLEFSQLNRQTKTNHLCLHVARPRKIDFRCWIVSAIPENEVVGIRTWKQTSKHVFVAKLVEWKINKRSKWKNIPWESINVTKHNIKRPCCELIAGASCSFSFISILHFSIARQTKRRESQCIEEKNEMNMKAKMQWQW